jgi:hypothetical protein
MPDGPAKMLHVLNLGAGVQSTTLYLMSLKGEEPEFVPRFDYAVFADTQEEPRAVYVHLEWLRSLGGIPILTGTAGKLGDDLARGVNSTGQRFASIPAYTAAEEGGEEGRTRRQCTREYKTDVVEQVIRRQILGLDKGERVPTKAVHVAQYLGLSFDEPRRRAKVMARFHAHPWASCHFPLFDLFVTRAECRTWLARQAIPHTVPRSACTFCPFHSNAEWRDLRDNDSEGWTRAVEVDEALRREGAIVNRGLDQRLYVHRSCVPLARADIDTPEPDFVRQRFSFSGLGVVEEECEGMCGV